MSARFETGSMGVGGVLARGGLALSMLCISSLACSESLIDIYQLAVENDPEYKIGFHQKNATSEVYYQARSALLPAVDFEYTRMDTTQEIVSSDNQVFGVGETDYPTKEYTLSINQSLFSYANWAGFKQAKAEVRQAASELEDVRQGLVLRVAERYFTVLVQQESHEYMLAEKSAIKQHYDLVRAKHRDGLVRVTELADAESRYMGAVASEIESSNELDDSMRGIKEVSGSLPGSLTKLSAQLAMTSPDPTDQDDWVRLAFEQNPRVMMRRLAVEVADQEIKRQKGGHYPTLDLILRQNERDTDGSLFGGGSDVETRDIMLQLNLPLYAGGSVSSRGREAAELYLKSKEELSLEMRAVERETLAAYQGVVGAIARVEALEKLVQAQELAVHSKRTAYESGLATTLTVLDAERDLFLARRDYARARYDYLLYTLKLKRAVGSLREADLMVINELLGRTTADERAAGFAYRDLFTSFGRREPSVLDRDELVEVSTAVSARLGLDDVPGDPHEHPRTAAIISTAP